MPLDLGCALEQGCRNLHNKELTVDRQAESEDELQPVRTRQRDGSDLPLKEHILMVNDLPRAQCYLEAMQAKIRPGDVVLEVGTGAGLLSCLAARLGAAHVYTVEQSPVLHRIACEVVAVNALSDKITLINAHSHDLQSLGLIKQPVDVFVTETIGRQGLEEGIVPIFDDIKGMLAPNARVIPETVRFKHCLVNMSGIREQVELLHPILGVDLSPLDAELKSNEMYWTHPIEPWREVSTIAETPECELLNFTPVESNHSLDITSDNMCDGLLNWAEFRLADGLRLETRCRYLGAHWANSVHLMARGLVTRGQTCTTNFRYTNDRLSWGLNWSIRTE